MSSKLYMIYIQWSKLYIYKLTIRRHVGVFPIRLDVSHEMAIKLCGSENLSSLSTSSKNNELPDVFLVSKHWSNMDHTPKKHGHFLIYKCIPMLDGGRATHLKNMPASQIVTCLQGSGEKYKTNPSYIPLYSLVHGNPFNGLVLNLT